MVEQLPYCDPPKLILCLLICESESEIQTILRCHSYGLMVDYQSTSQASVVECLFVAPLVTHYLRSNVAKFNKAPTLYMAYQAIYSLFLDWC